MKKSDEEKKAKDNQIKQLNDEMARQDEQLLKTQNAKKQVCNRNQFSQWRNSNI